MTISEVVAYFLSHTKENAKGHKVLNIGGHRMSIECVTDFGGNFNLTNNEGEVIDAKFGSRKSKSNPNGGKHVKRHYKVSFNLAENYEKWLLNNENRAVGDGSNNGHDNPNGWIVSSVLYQYKNGNIVLQYLTESKAFSQCYSEFVFDNGTKLTESEVTYLKRFIKPSPKTAFRNVSLSNIVKITLEGIEVEVIK